MKIGDGVKIQTVEPESALNGARGTVVGYEPNSVMVELDEGGDPLPFDKSELTVEHSFDIVRVGDNPHEVTLRCTKCHEQVAFLKGDPNGR